MMVGLVAASRARTLMKTEHTNVDCATGCMPIVPMNIQDTQQINSSARTEEVCLRPPPTTPALRDCPVMAI